MKENIKKINLFICSLMLVLTGLFFVACGGIDYSKVNVVSDQDHISLMVGEETTVNFTIENLQGGMSENLTFSLQGNSIVIDANQPNNATTSVAITAVDGGRTTIIATAEGQKTCQVIVDVLKPSESLGNGENTLYVTENKALSPNSIDFKFDSDAVLRNLSYNFYGVSNDNTVLLENVKNGEEFVNEFKTVYVRTSEAISEQGKITKVSHLVFEDLQGNFFTLNEFDKTTDRKQFCQFVPLEKEGESFNFNENHLKVYPGDKFTFVARYLDDPESQIYVQRDFYIYTNLDKNSISFNLRYMPKPDGVLEQECDDQENIVLIPNRAKEENSTSMIDYGRVRANFSISASELTQNLIKIEAYFKDDFVANKIVNAPIFSGENLVFPIEITSATTRSVNTTLVVRFFYQDLKDVTDEGVSYEVEVPVEIIYQPEDIVINDGNFDPNQTLTFYNTYYDDQSGWERFNFALNPTDAKYDSFVLSFDANEVNIRYNGTIYNADNCEKDNNGNSILEISDLSLPVEARGLREGGRITGNGVSSSIGIAVNYNIGGTEGSKTRSINYVVKSGADHIAYEDENIGEDDILYMSLSDTTEKFFTALKAKSIGSENVSIDAEFSYFSVMLESGEDVVDILTQSKFADDGKDTMSRLKIGLKSKALGYGIYRVTLDNGVRQVFRVQVIEELKGLNIEITEGANAVKFCDEIVGTDKMDNIDNLGKSFSNSTYILHGNLSDVKFEIFANNNRLSQAISQPSIETMTANGFGATLDFSNFITLNISATGDGSGSIQLKFYSFKIADNFKEVICENTYTMNIVSYSFMNSLVIQDENDNPANYVELFANSPRGDSITLTAKDSNGFMFYDYNLNTYVASEFDAKFIYWQTSLNVNAENRRMIYGNTYNLGDEGDYIARFDTTNMSITPLRNGEFELYAMVDQYAQNQPKIFSIKVKIEDYIRVESISTQDTLKSIDFSLRSSDRVREIVVQVTPNNANSKSIKALYSPSGEINIFGASELPVKAIDEENGVFLVTLDASKFVYEKYKEDLDNSQTNDGADNENEGGGTGNDNSGLNRGSLGGKLMIVPTDWLSDNNILIYDGGVVNIDINFQTGDKQSPYILRTADDVIAIKEDLSAYYALATTIDLSNQFKLDKDNENNKDYQKIFPLGVFTGHLTGITEDAKITGIDVRYGLNSNYISEGSSVDVTDYGLFSQIAKDAVIKDVSFAGKFDIDNEKDTNTGRRMGIVAGLNSGTLKNIGVELTGDCIIKPNNISTGNGLRLGGVVGGNEGTIIQGYSLNSDTKEEIENEQKAISPKITFYAGQYTIKIDAEKLSEIKNDGNLIQVRVGGIVGRNQGDIIKKSSNNGQGYANYMAFTNIEVINQKYDIRDDIGGLVGVSEKGNIYSENSDSPIIVGGRLYGVYAVGGIAGKVIVENGSIFKNITSRTFVRGVNFIGAISAKITNENSVVDNVTNFNVQAVDAGDTGFGASMLVKDVTNQNSGTSTTADESAVKYEIENQNNRLKFAFGEMTGIKAEPKFASYVIREREDSITDNSLTKYYGDYIEIKNSGNTISDDKNYSLVGYSEFDKKRDDIQIFANSDNGFKAFETNINNLFYMFYFGANALNITGNDDTLTKVQDELNRLYNTQKTDSSLYPIFTKGEVVFSTNSNILSIDHSGTISVTGTGVATIIGSSVLNANEVMTIKVYVTNYFNHSEEISVVYPSMSQTSMALVEGSEAHVKGDNVLTQYIRPSYELSESSDEGQTSVIATKFGNMIVANVSISLIPNTALTADLTYDASDFDISCIGQTITLKRKDNLHNDKEIYVTVKPYIMAESDKAYVNQKFNYMVRYKKGAISIKTTNYEKATITTGQTLKDTIVINSTAKEENVKFTIVDSFGRDVLNEEIAGSTNKNWLFSASIVDEKGKSVMNLPQSNSDTGTSGSDIGYNYGEQKFYLTVNVDINSEAYLNRFERNIYGTYYMRITAGSDSDVFIDIELSFVNVPLNTITIDNYNSRPTGNQVLSSTSNVSYPGREGVLALTLSPDTADFDYILIENDLSNDSEGNGKASFGLLTKTKAGESSTFIDSIISGSVTERGIKLTFNDILRAHNNDSAEQYHGVIYLRYVISSLGVREGGKCAFRITAVKENSFTKTYIKEVELVIQNHVYLSLEGKTSTSQDISKPVFEVARGLRYRINVDKYGFTDDEISITSESGAPVSILKENGEYFVQVLSNISYNGASYKNVEIKVEGRSDDGVRQYQSVMTLTIREFNVNYNNRFDKNSDIIRGMSDGRINLQIGNPFNLRVDFESFIEFDATDASVVESVRSFIESLQEKATWKVYTNLNGLVSSGETLKDDLSNAKDIFDFTKENNVWPKLETIYFTSDGLRFTPIMTHTNSQKFYVFTFQVNFENVAGGKYEAVAYNINATDSKPIETRFTFNVTTSSSLEHPIPIDNQTDLMNMTEGSHYILMKDIELDPRSFQPINANFKSFDGNGYTISFVGQDSNIIYYDFGNESNMGLFSTIGDGTIVKNVTVKIGGGIDDTSDNVNNRKFLRFKTSSTSFNVGLIAGQNNGIITNCYVYSEYDTGKYTYLTVDAGGANSNGYIAGITGSNGGYITNSRSSIYAMSAYYNLSGFVGVNNGKIASSYYKNGILIGSSTDRNVAGFVLTNGSGGQIITSYVSGERTRDHLLVADRNESMPNHYITSTTAEGGFAYTNQGLIENCYSNIRILGNSTRAGFVYRNEGEIKKSFSLSILENNSISSAGFAMDFSDGESGTFEDCYYVSDEDENINILLKPITFEGVRTLTIDEFSDYNQFFSNYVYSTNLEAGNIWFVSKGNVDSTGIFTGPFANGGLELVSANIISYSRQKLLSQNEDSVTGDVVYTYVHEENSNGDGDIKNPYIIFDAESFEYYLGSDNTKIVDENVRIVADIDYQSYEKNSQSFRTIFNGILEGNGMEIRNIRLVSTERLGSAGLFAQIGQNATSNANTIMNFELTPRIVSFASTTSVGALAGLVSNGNVYNVSVNSSENLTVIGNNFVGGLFGRTQGVNKMKNISSNVSVTANFKPEEDFQYREGYGNEGKASYAGSLIGFAGQSTTIVKAFASEIGTILGDRAGYMFGGIGSDADISYVYADISPNAKIRATRYGGMVAGEMQGKLSEVDVYGSDSEVSIFAIEHGFTPISVGGIAGRANGGSLTNILMSQSFTIGNYQTSTSMMTANYVGGFVGYVRETNVSIQNARMTASISTCGGMLGGAVGIAERAVNLDSVVVADGELVLSGQTSSANVGGIVGGLIDSGRVSMNQCVSASDIIIDISAHRVDMNANASALVVSSSSGNVTMSNCFANSQISVKMIDLSAINGTVSTEFKDGEIKQWQSDNETVISQCDFVKHVVTNINNASLNIYNYGKPETKASENPTVPAYKPSFAGIKDKILIGGGNLTPDTYEQKGVTIYSSDIKDSGKTYFIESEKLTYTYTVETGTGKDKKTETKKEIKDSIEFLDKRFVLYEKGDFVAVANGKDANGKTLAVIRQLGDEFVGKYIECDNQNVVWHNSSVNIDESLEMTIFNLDSILDRNQMPEGKGIYLFFETNLFWKHK